MATAAAAAAGPEEAPAQQQHAPPSALSQAVDALQPRFHIGGTHTDELAVALIVGGITQMTPV
jgi:hypothetical protein